MRRLIGIARLMLAETFRMKIAVIVIFFLAAILAAIPFILKTDDTQPGHVKLTLTYSMNILVFLLSVLTVFLSTFAVSSKIKGGQMLIMDTKPVRRWEIMLGKGLGIMLLNLALIILMGGIIWALTAYIARPAAGTEQDQEKIRTEVLTARRSLYPDPPQISDEDIETVYRQKLDDGRLPDNHVPAEEKQKIKRDLKKWSNVVPYGYQASWTISGVYPKQGEKLILKYKATASSTTVDEFMYGTWVLGSLTSPGLFQAVIKETFESPHELEIPHQAVDSDGKLTVGFINYTPPYRDTYPMAMFTESDSIQVLYQSGSFGANFIKALLLIFVTLGFLCAVGIALGSLFSFQVAAYILIVLLICSGLVGGVKDVVLRPITLKPGLGAEAELSERIISNPVVQLLYRVIFLLVPELHHYSPVNMIATGIEVSWGLIARAVLLLFMFKAGIVSLLGWYFFNRKELAAAAT